MAKTSCYLQLRAEIKRLSNGNWKVDSVRVVHLTQNAPTTLNENASHLLELNLEIPDEMLQPISIDATVPALQLQYDYEAVMKELEE